MKYKELYHKIMDEPLDTLDITPQVSGLDNTLWLIIYEDNPPVVTIFDGNPTKYKNKTEITIEDSPKVLSDGIELSKEVIEKIKTFVKNNKDNLLKYWNFDLDTDILFDKIIKESVLMEMSRIPISK